MSINLVQWEGSTVTPKLDAIIYDEGSYGIIKGCTITYQGTNLLKIANGFIKIAGRLIEISEETISCEVSPSGTVNGQLWVRMDLSAVNPVQFMTEAAAVLTPLTQNKNCNFENGIFELQLATYNIDESVISNLTETADQLLKLRETLTASNDVPFRFGYDSVSGEYGYIINEGGADTLHPFKTKHTKTYTASTRGASLDMGADHKYRYVNTNGVPNSNSGTKTITSSDANWYTGNVDMGATNSYRYVNAVNVYKKGKADAVTLIGTYTGNKTINVSSYIKSGDTVDNFLVELISIPHKYGNQLTAEAKYSGSINGTTIVKTLSGNTLSISGATIVGGCAQNVNLAVTGVEGKEKSTAAINYKLWYVDR